MHRCWVNNAFCCFFFSGFFSGCSVALVIAIVLIVRARRILTKEEGFFYLDNMFGLYRQANVSKDLYNA